MLTQSRLKELLHYDQATGVFTWLVDRSPQARRGDVAGKVEAGYRRIKVDGQMYRAHRLAWLYVHGTIPRRLDHRDNIGDHNWISNLRPCTQSQNCANRVQRSDNKSGFKGVSIHTDGRWQAKICFEKRQRYLGLFDTAEEAHEVYRLAADLLHGEFANYGAVA